MKKKKRTKEKKSKDRCTRDDSKIAKDIPI